MKKRTLKVFTFFAAVLLLTSAASYFFIKGYIYPLIISSTKKVIHEVTGGETEIGKVEFSIFPPGFEMTEITFSLSGVKETSFRVKKIRAELNPIQAFSGTMNINNISVIEPEMDIFLSALPKKLTKKDTFKDKLQPEFFKVNIKKIHLEKGDFIIRFNKNEFIEINEAYLSTSKTDEGEDMFSIKAAKGKLAIKGQQEDLSNIKLEGTRNESEIVINTISISPAWGILTASATIGMQPSVNIKGKLKGTIPFSRVSRYIKKELPLRGQGDMAASFSYRNNKADITASLAYKKNTRPLELKTSLLFSSREIKVRIAELTAHKMKANLEGSIFPGNKLDLRTKMTFSNLSAFLSPIMSPVLKGNLSGEGKIEGSLSRPEIKGSIKAINIAYREYITDEIGGTVNYANKKLWSEEVKVSHGHTSFTAAGSLFFPGETPMESDITINIPASRISELLAIAGKNFPIAGQIKSWIKFKGTIERPIINGELTIGDGNFFGERTDYLKLKGEYIDGGFNVEELLLNKDQSTIRVKGSIPEMGEMNLTYEAKQVDLSTISHIDKKVEGLVNLKGKIEGKPSSPIVRGTLTAENIKSNQSDIAVTMGGELYAKVNTKDLNKQMISYSSNKLQLRLNDKTQISLTPFTMKFDEGLLSFSRTSFSDNYGSISVKGSLDLKGNTNISLKGIALLNGLENKLKGVENIEGRVDVDLKIRGKIDKPLLRGTINAKEGLVRFKGFPYDMNNINGKLNLKDNRIMVDNLKGKLEGSDFTGGGHLVFDGYMPSEIKLYFDVEEVDLTIPRWLPSRSKGRMTVTAIGKEVTLGGDIEVLRASYTDEVEFKSFLAKIIKLADRKKIDEKTKEKADKDDLNVKIHFRADDNLIIKNNLSNMELKGDLLLTGKGSELSIIGNLETIGGKGYFRNREFLIRKGTVDFSNKERIVPVVNIDAETSIKDYLVNVNVAGPPKNLVFTLNSEPPLEEKEIVSLVTFGYTGSELRGQGTELTSLGAASLIFQEDIESSIKQYFGFDRLRIEPYYSETAETTEARITVDKDLGKNTTATYSRGMSTLDEEVKLEYKLDDNLSFEGTWASTEETVGAFGGDVILRFEFE